ncbi:MAG: hypothetical protein PUG16_03015 [Lachnospiraceae bacterium]|nr:hypothetical protein [Lachnospiraceae bacterium]
MELSFREKGLKKSTKRKILRLCLTFLAAFIVFFLWMNRSRDKAASNVQSPTLPVISVQYHDQEINELYGYTEDMDALYMRNAVAPLGDDRTLNLQIRTYGTTVKKMSYEVRSLDTERKIADESRVKFTEKKNQIQTSLQIANLIEENTEYLLVLTLHTDEGQVHYYCRIVQDSSSHAAECLDFAHSFQNMAWNKDSEGVGAYLETDGLSSDTSELQQVDIHSTADQVAWKSFDGSLSGSQVTELTEVTSDYSAMEMTYRMAAKDSSGRKTYYDVDEYFKIRYGSGKMYLLDYQRTMNQIYDPEKIRFTEDGLLTLGLGNRNVNYISNAIGTVTAFEMDGELYEFNENTGNLTRVFSFRNGNLTDRRLNNQSHSIMLLNMDENGTMDFVVYGYMNAGPHEGKCGIGLYRYSARTGNTQEQTFIQSTKSYQILKAGFSDLLYKSNDNIFYVMVDGTLLKIDLNTLETSEMLTEMKTSQYAASKTGRYLSWTDKDEPSDSIHVIDLETRKQFDIKAGADELLRPLVYIDNDFVYGTVRKSDMTSDSAGGSMYPMYKIDIAEVTGGRADVLKEYTRDGCYVTGVSEDSYTLYLNLVSRAADGSFTADAQDTIKDNAGERNQSVTIVSSADGAGGLTLGLQMAKLKSPATSFHFQQAGFAEADKSRTITVKATHSEQQYYVYVGGNVVDSGSDPVQAIQRADSEMGIVVDNSARYIWKRSRKNSKNSLTLAVGSEDKNQDQESQCLSTILNFEGKNTNVHSLLAGGNSALQVLQSNMDQTVCLDLTGISLSEALYYVSNGTPVYVEMKSGPAVLAGYSSSNVSIYHPEKGSYESMSLAEAEQSIAQAGSVYIAYVK